MRRALDGNPPVSTYHGQPGYGYFGRHAGYDYPIVRWAVRAPEAGTILNVWTGRETVDGGNIVELQGQYTHRFLHLQSASVKVGQKVAEGQELGITGNTGNVGFHLHHDVRKNGTRWTDSFSNYIDWEQLIKSAPSAGGKDMPIPNADNYYGRYNKAMSRIRGRTMTREEFNKNFVGQTDLRMLEAMLDDVEADNYYSLGQWAKANKAKIEQQVKDQQAQLAAKDKLLLEIKSKADLSDSLQKKVDQLTAERQKDTDTGNAFIRWIGGLFNKQ